MNISKIFIERPIMTTLVMVAILFFGIFAYKKLPVSDLPDVEFPAITVTTTYPGASPETIANNVSTPLEQAFLTIGGLKNIISTSTQGSSSIVLQFAIDRSIDAAAQDVQASINQAAPHLPKDLPFAPTYQKVNPSQTPIIWFALSSATMPSYQLYDYAYSFVGERISTIDGVAQVVVFGSPFAVRVQVDPLKLAAKGIGLDDVAYALRSQNVNIPTGTLYGHHTEFIINVDGQLNTAEAYNSIVIKNDNGSIVRMQDIGKALDSLSNDKQYLRFISTDHDLNTVVFGVRTQPGANSMTVIQDIDDILPNLEKALPGSINLKRVFDKSVFIEESVVDVQFTLFIAFLLVVFVIFFYLGKVKNTLIPALALPISVIGTFIVMLIIGYTIDILSLLAITLCIGFLVDDAIVVLENIARHSEMGKTALQAALDGSKEISFTILSMTLSLGSIFIPLLFMGGIMGKIFHEFAVVILTAVLISGFVSLSLTPMLSSKFIEAKALTRKTWVEKIADIFNKNLLSLYEKALRKVFLHPRITLALGIASVAVSVLLFKELPTDFLPQEDLGAFQVFSQSVDGTSTFQTIDYQKQINSIIQKYPHIDTVCSVSGYPDDNKGFLFVNLKSFKERPHLSTIMKELKEELSVVPGLQFFFKPVPLIDLDVSTSTTKSAYQYTLQGLNTESLYKVAGLMLKKITALPGFKQVSTDLEIGQPKLMVHILRDKASILNISSQAIEQALSYAYGATYLSPINTPQNQYYVILEVEPKFYRDPKMLSLLYVKSSTGDLIPLSSITKMEEKAGPLNINRIAGLPAVNIFFDLDQVPLGTALSQIHQIATEILPPDVTGNVVGTASTFKESFRDLNFLLLITFFLIYIILGILYENFFHPMTVMSTLPPAALGGILTLMIFGYPLSLYAFVGFILLLGIVMKNGIIMVDFANEATLKGKDPVEAITAACLTRFRPILMTTFSALMGAVPIALGIGGMTAQGRIPLGLVIVGGLLFSQLLTLFLTPIVYLYLERFREWIAKKN
jgi:HAE1 family hydrophobic/amphiphilic exporter-1